jgi:membrane-associated phospholipid phosphatase
MERPWRAAVSFKALCSSSISLQLHHAIDRVRLGTGVVEIKFTMLRLAAKHCCALALGILATSCGTLNNGRGWGQDVNLLPPPSQIGTAFGRALRDPATWAPAAAATLFAATEADENLSTWARDHTPLFGSEQGAFDGSSKLRDTLAASTLVTALATPSGKNAGPWMKAKLQGLAVEGLALWTTHEATFGLKRLSGRERPNDVDDMSFPSSRSANAFALAALSGRNLESLPMPEPYANTARVTLQLIASGAAWGRVESGSHFPSDVLAGAALGNFVASFIHDAFFGSKGNWKLAIEPLPAGTRMKLEVRH